MSGRKKRRRPVSQPKASPWGWQPSYWMIVAVIAIFFVGGVMVKAIFSSDPNRSPGASNL